MISRLLQGRDERLYGLACVRSNVGLAEVNGSGVLALELEPCVYDGLGFYERSSLSPTKFPLVHVITFLLVAALGLIMPRLAIAEVHWEEKSDESYYGYVYPIKYTSWTADAPYALAEYAGFDYDSFSVQVSDALYEQDNGDNPWTRALGETYNMAYGLGEIDAGGGGGGHAFGEPEAGGGGAGHYFGWIVEASRLYGYDSIWRINLTKSEYEELRIYIKKWALPRDDAMIGTISNKVISVSFEPCLAYANTPNSMPTKCYIADNNGNKYCFISPAYNGMVSAPVLTANINLNTTNVSSYDLSNYLPYIFLKAGNGTGNGVNIGDASVYLIRKGVDVSLNIETKHTSSYGGIDYPKAHLHINNAAVGDLLYGNASFSGANNGSLIQSGSCILSVNKSLGEKDYYSYNSASDYAGLGITPYGESYMPTPDQPTPAPQQPEEPVEPDKTPDAPIQWPVITWPTIDWPDITVIVPGAQPSGTTPQDYTPWLRQIDDDIRLYGDGIVAAFGDLHDDLEQGFSDLLTGINIVTRYVMHFGEQWTLHCDHITDSIDDGFYGLKTYFGANFRWLVDEVGADLDDMQSSVVSWLKRIYSRIRGYPSSKPSYDDDPAGWADWFVDTITDILGGVIGGAASVAGQALTLFQRITGLFPFSLPWDMYAILLLFETPAQAPQFSIDWQLMEDLRIAFDVDCTPWDGTMQAVRAVEFVAFCGGLAKLSVSIVKDMYGLYKESTIS